MDLTAYVEKHEFVFDAVLDQHVSNDEVFTKQCTIVKCMLIGVLLVDCGIPLFDAGHAGV